MKPNCFHRFTALVQIVALLGSTYPAPLLAQVEPEPAPIASTGPLSLPPTGPQPEAGLLHEQEQMLARQAVSFSALETARWATAGSGEEAFVPEPVRQLPVFPKFSDAPTDAEIGLIQLFDSIPVPFGAGKPGENIEFVRALEKGREMGWLHNGLDAFEEYVRMHRGSRWEVAVRREIAQLLLRDGFFTSATTALERAWDAAKGAQEPSTREAADRIAAQLAELYAQTGAKAQLAALAEATKDRPMSEVILDRLHHAPMNFGAKAVRGFAGAGTCGASALASVWAALDPNKPELPLLKDHEKLGGLGLVPGPQGYSLRQLGALADAAGFPMRAIRRATAKAGARVGSDWPVPSLLHWKRGHYSALIRRAGSQYLLRDFSLGGDRYITAAALREEASGFLLVEDKPLAQGWEELPKAEADKVFGTQFSVYYTNPENPKCDKKGKSCCGMPVFDFGYYKGALLITDSPVGYTPARGPDMHFTLSYNHVDPNDVSGIGTGTAGPNWSWSAFGGMGQAYVEIDQNGTDMSVHEAGGVIERYEGVIGAPWTFAYNYLCPQPDPLPEGTVAAQYGGTYTYYTGDLEAAPFTPTSNYYSKAILQRFNSPQYALVKPTAWAAEETVNWSSHLFPQFEEGDACNVNNAIWKPPLTLVKRNRVPYYERVQQDGTREVFDLKAGTRYLLTKIIYPDGGEVHFNFGGDLILDSVSDYTGATTLFAYEKPGFPKLITKVTDPFGRTAVMEYDASGRLIAITDALGMRSSFDYKGGSTFIQKMTTPYGETTFSYSRPALGVRVLEATDPLGGRQRLQWGSNSGATFYWDQRAMRNAGNTPPDPAAAHLYTWAGSAQNAFALRPILIKERHPLENEITYSYDGQPNGNSSVAGTTAQPKTITRMLFNPGSNDFDLPQTTQYEYDGNGHAIKVTDPKGRVTEYAYLGEDLSSVKQFINASGNVHYDTLAVYANYHPQAHAPQQVTDAAGRTTNSTYDSAGRLLTVARQRTVNSVLVTEATTYAYYPDATGSVGQRGRLSTITGPVAGAVTNYGYDAYGRVNSVTNPEGYTLTYLYDHLDRVVKTTYPDGTYEQGIYNRLEVGWQRDRAGRWTHTEYDANREVERVTDPAGRVVQFQRCQGCGALEGLVDGEGNRTSFAFDGAGRLTNKIYADGSGLSYEYEAGTSRLASMTDAKHQVTHYAYNVDNTLAGVSYTDEQGNGLVPPTPGMSYTYDPYYKRLATMTDQFGATAFGYYPAGVLGAGRLQFENGPEAGDVDKVVHTYDEYGRELSSAINGVAEARTYDALGRVATGTNPLGTFTNNYASAVSGRVVQVLYPGGHKAEYGYHPKLPAAGAAYAGDKDFRLSQIKNTRMYSGSYAQVASRFDYDYDQAGNIASWYQSGSDASGQVGQVWQMGYDAADQLTGAAVKTAYMYNNPPYIDSTSQQQLGYSYDRAGNRVTEQNAVRQTNGSYSTTLTSGTHNALNQLTSRSGGSGEMIMEGTVNENATVTVGGQAAQVWRMANGQYAYRGSAHVNAGANSVPIVARDSSYTGANQTNINEHQTTRNAQVQATGVAIPALAYDLNGNLIRETRPSGSQRLFEWDAANRLVKVADPDTATTTEWRYSGRGQRMEEKVNGTVTAKWRWNGMQMREMVTISGTTSSLRRYYAHGMQWTPNLAQPNTTTNYFFFRDHLGSLREMIDATGNLHKRYTYDLWGRRTQTVNTTTVPEPMLGFTGHFYHASTGLHLAFFRAYSAELRGWLSRDPYEEEGGINIFEYVLNNPTKYLDPDGLAPKGFSTPAGNQGPKYNPGAPEKIKSGNEPVKNPKSDTHTPSRSEAATTQGGIPAFINAFLGFFTLDGNALTRANDDAQCGEKAKEAGIVGCFCCVKKQSINNEENTAVTVSASVYKGKCKNQSYLGEPGFRYKEVEY